MNLNLTTKEFCLNRQINFEKIFLYKGLTYAIAVLNNKIGLISPEGKPLTDFIYDYNYNKENEEYFYAHSTFCELKLNNKWGIVNNKGKIVLDFIYDKEIEIQAGHNNSSIVKADAWGIFDKNWRAITEFKYDNIKYFDNECYLYSINNKQGFMDLKGNILVEPIYDNIITFRSFYFYKKGYYCAKVGKNAGVIDKFGNKIIEFKYAKFNLWNSDNKFIVAQKVKNGEWGVIDIKDKIILNFDYDDIKIVEMSGKNNKTKNIFFVVEKDGQTNLLNEKGAIIA